VKRKTIIVSFRQDSLVFNAARTVGVATVCKACVYIINCRTNVLKEESQMYGPINILEEIGHPRDQALIT